MAAAMIAMKATMTDRQHSQSKTYKDYYECHVTLKSLPSKCVHTARRLQLFDHHAKDQYARCTRSLPGGRKWPHARWPMMTPAQWQAARS
eukprot:scaffold330780_cov47-Prasinocladus_malaysianus.AAC.1